MNHPIQIIIDHYNKKLNSILSNQFNFIIKIHKIKFLKELKEKKTINIVKKKVYKSNKMALLKENKSCVLNTIKIIDNNYNSCELYVAENKMILNDQHKVVGTLYNWIDHNDEVPAEFKHKDNTVVNPLTIIPLIELELYPQAGIYCNIIPGIYREYEYNDQLQSFTKTNKIII